MSEKNTYTAVTHLTIRVQSRIELTTEGLRIQLKHDPMWSSDTTIFVQDDQQPIENQEHKKLAANLISHGMIRKLSEMIKAPEGTEVVPSDSTKAGMN